MTKNILFSITGVVLGFIVGFSIANSLTKPDARNAAATRTSADGSPRPLAPGQTSGELPPGHPDISGAEDGAAGATAASSSPQAQAAMDRADRSPKDFNAQMEAAQVFYNLSDYSKSALYLDRALAIKPKDYEALVLMGNTKYDDGRFDDAALFYERALAVNPQSPDVRTDLGNTFFKRQDYRRALAEYRKSVAASPDHVNSWKNIAIAALELQDKATAQEAVERLSTLDPQSPELPAIRQKLSQLP